MRRVTVVMVVLLLLLSATAVLAGSWAVVELDSPPGEIHAGEPWPVGFTVLQHGRTPVHRLGPDVPVEPLLVATSAAGRRLEVPATPAGEVGHFVAEVTFPAEGTWEWTIYPNPLGGETPFEPLTVLPVPAVQSSPLAAAAVRLGVPGGLLWALLAVALVAVVWLVVQSRRRLVAAKS